METFMGWVPGNDGTASGEDSIMASCVSCPVWGGVSELVLRCIWEEAESVASLVTLVTGQSRTSKTWPIDNSHRVSYCPLPSLHHLHQQQAYSTSRLTRVIKPAGFPLATGPSILQTNNRVKQDEPFPELYNPEEDLQGPEFPETKTARGPRAAGCVDPLCRVGCIVGRGQRRSPD